MEAYCVKCKAKREMKDAEEITMKGKGNTKRRAMRGICPVCGTKMFRILGNK
jgi:Zn finger protein HypA/HybF involved in hydrogenase expression